MEKINKIGYGQVEPNRLAAQQTKSIFGQLPLADEVAIAENGMALVYDQVEGKVRYASEGEIVQLHMSEIILEDDRHKEDSDFVVMNTAATKLQVAMSAHPRLYNLTVGDKFITNVYKAANQTTAVAKGTLYTAGTDGYWIPLGEGKETGVVLSVVKETTLPDGQKALQFVVKTVGGVA